ncbi:hypothetical protein GOP47_0029388 [Adiantum capillus-veneris]|nr:hypothetical protein GOP47_0029388 [Adiantum capillus-veneris]
MLDLKKWRRLQEALCLVQEEGGLHYLRQKVEPKLKIACIEDWESIVKDAHCNGNLEAHKGIRSTLDTLQAHWCIDSHRHGIPLAYIKAFVDSCGCIVRKHQLQEASTRQKKIDINKPAVTITNIHKDNVENYLEGLVIEHKARIQDRVNNDDWTTMYSEVLSLQKQQKVLYVQPYNPSAIDAKDRPKDRICSNGMESTLIGQSAQVCNDSNSFYYRIKSCEYPLSHDEERIFTLSVQDASEDIKTIASTTRIVLVYRNSIPMELNFF